MTSWSWSQLQNRGGTPYILLWLGWIVCTALRAEHSGNLEEKNRFRWWRLCLWGSIFLLTSGTLRCTRCIVQLRGCGIRNLELHLCRIHCCSSTGRLGMFFCRCIFPFRQYKSGRCRLCIDLQCRPICSWEAKPYKILCHSTIQVGMRFLFGKLLEN